MIKVKIDKNKKGEPNFKLHFKKINEKEERQGAVINVYNNSN